MRDRVVFDKMGLRIGTQTMSVNGSSFKTDSIRGFALRKEGDFREAGLLVSTTVFTIMALVFLVPIIEDLLKPKFFFVVAVGVFLAAVSMQDFFNIKNPGETRLMLVTDYGARFGMRTTSSKLIAEAVVALENLGITQDAATSPAALRMKTTASGTSSAS